MAIGWLRKSGVLLGLVLAVGLAGAHAKATVVGPHAVAGFGELPSGATLTINAGDRLDESYGTAWFDDGMPLPASLEINLSCMLISWYSTPYPLYPWVPAHVLFAAGAGSDGATHYITIYESSVPSLGLPDLFGISDAAGDAPCGSGFGGEPIHRGDFVIAP